MRTRRVRGTALLATTLTLTLVLAVGCSSGGGADQVSSPSIRC
jgi:hypothetical protein